MAASEYIYAEGLTVGILAGFLMHRSGFCLAGAFRDIFLFRDGFMARILLLTVVASMLLFETARRLGLLAFYPFPLLGSPSAAQLLGGAVFGVGMVLAGGCVVGTLFKMGAGHLPAASAFLGLLAGSAAYAEIHPAWSAVRSALDLPSRARTVPQLLGLSPGVAVAFLVLPASVLFLRWYRDGKWRRHGEEPRGYVPPWAAGIGLAALGAVHYVFTGMPVGITTSYAKIAGWVESVVAPGHFASLSFFRSVALDAVNPATGEVLRGGPAPVLDAVAAVQLPVIAGVILGSALSAVLLKEFRVYRNVPLPQLLAAFAGGALMGVASRVGGGCNVWHLLGGLPILALPSLLFVAGLFPGAWAGGRLLSKIL